MSTVVTGRFECLIQAEEAMSESLLRFAREDVVLVPPPGHADGSSLVIIRARRNADRRIAVRTLQGRGAAEVEVIVAPVPVAPAALGADDPGALRRLAYA